jgi:O-antigen/teichoic acid export membrane protein
MSRTRRAVWTYATSLLATVVTVLLGLFTTPLLIRWLGDERFGACRVLLEYGGYLTLLELGVGGALSALLVQAVNSHNVAAVRRVLVVAVRVYVVVSMAMLIVGLLATPLLGYLGVAPEATPDLQLGWLLALAAVGLLPLSPFRTLIEAEQRGYWNNLLLLTQLVLTTLFAVLLAWLGWGIAGQMLAPLLAQPLVLAILVSAALTRYPGILRSVVWAPTDRQTWSEMRRLNAPALIFALCGRVSVLSDNIVLSVVAGPALVTTLFATQRLATLFQGQLQAIGNATWAGLAQLYVRGEKETFNRRLVELSGLVVLLGAACLVPVAAFNGSFVGLWLGSERYAGDVTTVLAVANAGMLALLALWGWCFSSTGRVGMLLAPALVNAALNLPISAAATWLFGVPGPLLGTFVSYAGLTVWWVAWLLHREFGTPLPALAGAVLRPLALAVPYAYLLRRLADIWPPSAWLSLLAAGTVSALGFLLLSWFSVLSGAERQRWQLRLCSFRSAPA